MPKFGPAISSTVLEILSGASVLSDPARVVLNCGMLRDRAVYEEVNEVLSRLGGVWKSGKVKAHVFESDPTEELQAVIATGMFPGGVDRNPLDFFPTPPALAKTVADLLGPLPEGAYVLEPSAGRGALIDAVLAKSVCHVVACELDPKHAAALRQKYLTHPQDVIVFEADFLVLDSDDIGPVEAVVMNPPFTADKDSLAYITHIQRAWELLIPGGTLVVVTPSGWEYRQDRRCTEFRAFVEAHGTFTSVDAGAFKESGTNVKTSIVKVIKPE